MKWRMTRAEAGFFGPRAHATRAWTPPPCLMAKSHAASNVSEIDRGKLIFDFFPIIVEQNGTAPYSIPLFAITRRVVNEEVPYFLDVRWLSPASPGWNHQRGKGIERVSHPMLFLPRYIMIPRRGARCQEGMFYVVNFVLKPEVEIQ